MSCTVWVLFRGGQYLQDHNVWSVSHRTARRFETHQAALDHIKTLHPAVGVKPARQTIFEQPTQAPPG